MADFEENVEEMVGMTREAAGGDRVRRNETGNETGDPAVPGTRPATRRRRRLVTNEMAATGGVMYTDEGELEIELTSAIFVWRALRNFAMADFEESVEKMVGTTREAADGDIFRRGRDRRSRGRDRRQDGGDGW